MQWEGRELVKSEMAMSHDLTDPDVTIGPGAIQDVKPLPIVHANIRPDWLKIVRSCASRRDSVTSHA